MSAATAPQDMTAQDDRAVEPLLYALREYPEVISGTTTVSSVSVTSPVRESGPDD